MDLLLLALILSEQKLANYWSQE